MLTPVEIQNKAFKSGGLGYDKKDVDSFITEIVESYEELYRDSTDLEAQVNNLTEELSYYKNIEKTLQKALILAEKTAEDTKNAALENARLIENEAANRAQMILSDAKRELDNINKQIINMTQTFEAYKINCRNLAASQIELLNSDVFNLVSTGSSISNISFEVKKNYQYTESPAAPADSDFEISDTGIEDNEQ